MEAERNYTTCWHSPGCGETCFVCGQYAEDGFTSMGTFECSEKCAEERSNMPDAKWARGEGPKPADWN